MLSAAPFSAGGRSVMMLMHHSRNTEQKQWEETLVLVLAGVTKVGSGLQTCDQGFRAGNCRWGRVRGGRISGLAADGRNRR